MTGQNYYREYEKNFTANGFETFNVFGDTLAILEVTGDIDFRIDNNPYVKLREGITLSLPPAKDFTRLDFVETGGSAASFTIAVGNGQILDNRLTVSSELDISKSNNIDTVDDVTLTAATATQIVASNTARRELLITNMTGDFIRIGDSGVGATSGVRVADGSSVILATTAAVYGYSTAGGDISITELED